MAELGELLARLRVSLEAVSAAADPSGVLDSSVILDVRRAEALLGEEGSLEARSVLGWLYWHMSQAFAESHDENIDKAIAFLAPCFVAKVGAIPGPLGSRIGRRAASIAREMVGTASASSDISLLSEAIDVEARVFDAAQDDKTLRSLMRCNIGAALLIRYQIAGDEADLDGAVEAQRSALEIATSKSLRFAILMRLAPVLKERFDRHGSMADLNAAVDAAKSAEKVVPEGDNIELIRVLDILNRMLRVRFERTQDLDDANDAVRAARTVVDLLMVEQRKAAGGWTALAYTLRHRFKRTGDIGDIDEAIEAARAVINDLSQGDPGHAAAMSNLCGALAMRYQHTGQLGDANEAVEAGHAAVEHGGSRSPLDQATTLASLADAYRWRFKRIGDLRDADESVRFAQAALAHVPAGHRYRNGMLHTLAGTFVTRAERTGSIADLDEAAQACRTAIELTSERDPLRGDFLTTLTSILIRRYAWTSATADLMTAIQAARLAVDAFPPGHPAAIGAVSNLTMTLSSRYSRFHERADLNEAIERAQAAILAAPEESGSARLFAQLSHLLAYRYDQTRLLADLDAAISYRNAAMRLTRSEDYARGGFQAGLAILLEKKYNATRDPRHLNDAIENSRRAVEGYSRDDPIRGAWLALRGTLLATRFTVSRDDADLASAVNALREAAGSEITKPRMRITAARRAAPLLAETDPGAAARILENAVRQLVALVPRQLSHDDQQDEISGYAALAGDAAALALRDPETDSGERATKALQLLEAGRGVLIGQALGIRGEVTELAKARPDLAAKVSDLRERLEGDGLSILAEYSGNEGTMPWEPGEGDRRRRLAQEFEDVLSAIRAVAGFKSFGLPLASDEIKAQAADGPIVTFNISMYRSDALITTKSGINAVSLPDLTVGAIKEHTDIFYEALKSIYSAVGYAGEQQILGVLEWLWNAAAGPVMESLRDEFANTGGAERPRVWWNPGGLLGMLPVHAAGYHRRNSGEGSSRDNVLGRVVSSYTPTIRALRYARRPVAAMPYGTRALLVGMPTTPGHPKGNLPGVARELERVRHLVPDNILLIEPGADGCAQLDKLSSGVPSRQSLFEYLPGCAVVHFSCHGVSYPANPSQSRLMLHDHESTPLTVGSLAGLAQEQLQLVYLSACHTARSPDEKLQDEAIHLVSTFQVAGSRHVVGTLWAIADQIAADVAASFYRHLHVGLPEISTEKSSWALHEAVSRIRARYPERPSLWAAFIHSGR